MSGSEARFGDALALALAKRGERCAPERAAALAELLLALVERNVLVIRPTGTATETPDACNTGVSNCIDDQR